MGKIKKSAYTINKVKNANRRLEIKMNKTKKA